MPPVIVETIAPIIAMLSLGSFILIGMKMRYNYLQRTRAGSVAAQDIERLRDAVDSVRDEVQLLKEEFHRLDDRVEFAERLLERPKSADSGSDPPRAS